MWTRREFCQTATSALLGSLITPYTFSAMASNKKRPNVLFLLSDQHRHDWGSWNPQLAGRLHTPNLDWLSARGTRFSHAVCASPVCGPSRACLASGVEYDACGMVIHEKDWPVERLDSYYRLMRDMAGYHVMGCGKFDLRKASKDPGVQGTAHTWDWGFSEAVNIGGKWDAWQKHCHGEAASDAYYRALELASFTGSQGDLKQLQVDDYARRRGMGSYTCDEPTLLPDALYIDNWVAQTAAQLLARAPAGKPWYLLVNFSGPHEPLDITQRMAAQSMDRCGFPAPYLDNGALPPGQHERIRRNYSAMIENIDARIGHLIKLLRRRGELENTLIIYASDHGEMLGDRSRWSKQVPFHQSVGIPLVIAGPGVQAQAVNSSPVSLIDVGASILDYAGIGHPPAMTSLSLRPILENEQERVRDFVLSGLAGWRMLDDGEYKLILGHDLDSTGRQHGSAPQAPPILFDRRNDPDERQNIAASHPEKTAELTARLHATLRQNTAAPA